MAVLAFWSAAAGHIRPQRFRKAHYTRAMPLSRPARKFYPWPPGPLRLGRLLACLGLLELAKLAPPPPATPQLPPWPTELLASFRHHGHCRQRGIPFRPQLRV